MNLNKYLYFFIPKLLIIKDVRLGLANRLLQVGIITFMIFSLIYFQQYYKLETPDGYLTSFWAESNNMYEAQRRYTNSTTSIETTNDEFFYCDNTSINYIYAIPYWLYTNISCINLPYAEMYQKDEKEIFFMTMFTENKVNLENCDNLNNHTFLNDDNTTLDCYIKDRLDGNCLCQNFKNYFSIGAEDMKLVFDYKIKTNYIKAGNFEDIEDNTIGVQTNIYDKNMNLYKKIDRNNHISLNVNEWLDLAHTNLNTVNHGVDKSIITNETINTTYPLKRITGIDLILHIDCSNLIRITNMEYNDILCKIHPIINEGWSSMGSKINYFKYPNLLENDTYTVYFDRYRYGIKFKFLITGIIGNFNIFLLLNAIISLIVLSGTATTIIILIISNFLGGYTKKINNARISTSKKLQKNSIVSYMHNLLHKENKNSKDDEEFENQIRIARKTYYSSDNTSDNTSENSIKSDKSEEEDKTKLEGIPVQKLNIKKIRKRKNINKKLDSIDENVIGETYEDTNIIPCEEEEEDQDINENLKKNDQELFDENNKVEIYIDGNFIEATV